MRKPTMWFTNTNQAVHAQKMAKDWKFWIWKEEELYYPCSETKGTDLLRTFGFTHADCLFSHEAP